MSIMTAHEELMQYKDNTMNVTAIITTLTVPLIVCNMIVLSWTQLPYSYKKLMQILYSIVTVCIVALFVFAFTIQSWKIAAMAVVMLCASTMLCIVLYLGPSDALHRALRVQPAVAFTTLVVTVAAIQWFDNSLVIA